MRKARGFTLIEISVAIGIIGILFFAMLPVFSNMLGVLELKSLARSIVSDLRFAQEKAIGGKTTVSVYFLPRTLLGDPAGYVIKKMNVFKNKEDIVKRFKLPAKFDFLEAVTIQFAGTGFLPPGGSGTVRLEDRSSRVKRIVVSSAGRIRME